MKGSLKQRARGTWQLRYDLPRGEDGKRRPVSVTVRGTRKQAEAELARLLHEAETGLGIAPGRITLSEYLDRWVRDYGEAHWGTTFLRVSKAHIRNHLKPCLGHHLLARLTPLHIQGYYTKKREEGRLSEQTLLHHHRLLNQALKQAVRWRLVTHNVMEGVTAPRARPEEPHAYTGEQVKALLATAEGLPIHLPILLALTAGMRRGEIVALRWEDVDLKAGVLKVRWSRQENGHTKAPKSGKARVIALPPLAIDALTRHKGQQDAQRRELGLPPLECVTQWADGRVMRVDYVTTEFARLARGLSLPSTKFHDLRHTFASQMFKLGVHPKTVSEMLGHSDVTISLNRYTHMMPGVQEDAARRLDEALRAALGD